ncbi:MAG TPA: hypothetical protein VMT00_02255 [Thermoanaerobaculia bacterium]|nr:hypothetical protein [Thermoanaerobaculia bacterium]
MRRSTVRIVAVITLVLLGAPVTLHVVLHDLHGHDDKRMPAGVTQADHGGHEHPIVNSSPPVAETPSVSAVRIVVAQCPATSIRTVRAERNVMAHGAIRIDDDVGLQPLLSTFLI